VRTTGAPPVALPGLARARSEAGERFFDAEAQRLAGLCHRMAERFAAGGRLIALAATSAARSDARHVAVEFVHPVIVGKRALPALALTGDAGELARRADQLVGSGDIAIAFGAGEDAGATAGALAAARARGALSIAFAPAGAQWEFDPGTGEPDGDQELVETLYHVLWELVHVFFEHRGLLSGGGAGPAHDAGAAAFLYPFLDGRESDLAGVLADVAASIRLKAVEVGALRVQTLSENEDVLLAAATGLRQRLEAGGCVLALGNGGSATDAMDLVADLRDAPPPARAWPALDLAEDPAILTAIANDIGPEALFARQVIAHGGPDDALVAISTSGSSANVLAALHEARRRGLLTVALVGYDGGRIAAEQLADHVVITRSEHIPRIQEAQASAYHALRRLLP
jgi:D-sedoheptulose 7-phosphate isomerase